MTAVGEKQPMETQQDDRDYDPMLYDVMRELATQVCGRYIAWADEAATPSEDQHWADEALRVYQQVQAVDARSLAAVQEHTAALREILATLPAHAPAVA